MGKIFGTVKNIVLLIIAVIAGFVAGVLWLKYAVEKEAQKDWKSRLTPKRDRRNTIDYGGMYTTEYYGSGKANPRPNRDTYYDKRRSGTGVHYYGFENRLQAESVWMDLSDVIEEYGYATRKDYYNLINMQTIREDSNVGWLDLSMAKVTRDVNGKYVIQFPPTTDNLPMKRRGRYA